MKDTIIDAESLHTAEMLVETIKQRLKVWMAIQDDEKIAKNSIQQAINGLEFILSKRITKEAECQRQRISS